MKTTHPRRPLPVPFTLLMILSKALLTSGQDLEQPLSKVMPPSPTVASLMHFEELPVDYYTGQPDISIPLFSNRTHKDLSFSLTLKYSTQGVRIDERSGWTGTSWALDAGGVISRTVRDVPDEVNNSIEKGVLHNADFWNYANLTETEKDEFNWNTTGPRYDKYDTELDLYQFSFPGGSGRFVVVNNGGQLEAKLLSRDKKVKIGISHTADFDIYAFTVTDPNGLKYLFDVTESATSTTFSGFILQSSSAGNVLEPSPGSVYVCNLAWHLSGVRMPNDQLLMSINYETLSEAYTTAKTYTENRIRSIDEFSDAFGGLNDFFTNAYNLSILKPQRAISYFSTNVSTKKPSSLTFRDGTSIVLTSGLGHPETGGAILNNVILLDNTGVEYKRYTLNYQTVNERLWLMKITESAGGTSRDYRLEYLGRNDLPPFGSESDAWGYNVAAGLDPPTTDVPPNPNPDNIQKGLISKIIYPTGGSREFAFEHNRFTYGAGGTLSEKLLLTNPDNFDWEHFNINLSGTYDLDANNGLIYSQTVSFTHDHLAYIDFNSITMRNLQTGVYEPVDNMVLEIVYGSNESTRLRVESSAFKTLPVKQGELLMLKITALNTGMYEINGNIRFYQRVKKPSLVAYMYGGGVRIREIRFRSHEDSVGYARRFLYSYSDPEDSLKSSGAVDGILGNLAMEYEMTSLRNLFSSESNASNFQRREIVYEISSKGPNAQLSKGGYVGYKRVVVVEAGKGRSIYEYTTPQDYHAPGSAFFFPFSPAPNIDYKRGLLTKEIVYNQIGQKLREVVNAYSFSDSIVAPSLKVVDLEACAASVYYETYSEYVSGSATRNVPSCGAFPCFSTYPNCGLPLTHLQAFFHYLTTGRVELAQSIKIIFAYKSGVVTASTVTETFAYNQENFEISERNFYIYENSVEQHYKTMYFYAVGGYPAESYTPAENAEIDKLRGTHNINDILYTVAYKNGSPLTTTQYTYHEYYPGLVLPKEVRISQGFQLPETRFIFHSYDNMGNIREVAKAGDVRTVYLWGFHQTLPVARILNSTYAIASEIVDQSILDDPASEMALEQELDSLRSAVELSTGQITTFTYRIPYGIRSQTDANGIETIYDYDDYGRLACIIDHDGNVIKTFKYKHESEY